MPSVILVNPVIPFLRHWNNREESRRRVRRFYPPMNLLRLGGVLKSHGYRVHIIDCPLEPRPQEAIARICETEEVVCVGLTVKMAPLIVVAQMISYFVKVNFPGIAVVWGGILPTLLPEAVLRESYADYAVIGKGEEALLALCEAKRAGRLPGAIPGLAYLEGSGQAARFVSHPASELQVDHAMDLSLIGDQLNFRQIPYIAAMVTAEGCPYRCSFCYLSSLDHAGAPLGRWRRRPAELVLGEIDAYLAKGMRVVTFSDDNLFHERERILPIIAGLKERGVYIEDCISSINTLTPDVIREVAPIVQQIGYSIETVNPDLQKILNKPISVERILETNQRLFDAGINSLHNFIFGLPGETDDDLRLNVELAARLRGINPYVRFNGIFCVPEPFSRLETWLREEMGVSVPRDLRSLASADMSSLTVNPLYQPWIRTEEDRRFYGDFMIVFDALFCRWQHKDDPHVEELLRRRRLARIFEPALGMEKPPEYLPYILDRQVADPALPYPEAKFDIRR